MLGWRIICFCLCLHLNRSEELRGHHLRRALNHALAYACDCSTYLYVASVFDYRRTLSLFQINVARAFQKSRLAFAVNDHAIVLGLTYLFQAHVAFERSLDRAYASAKRCGVTVLARLLKLFTARNASLQNLRVGQSLKDSHAPRAKFVRPFNLHSLVIAF